MKRAVLNHAQTMRMIRAATLMQGFSAVLSDHERNVVAEAVIRFRRHGAEASVSSHEWPVIDDAVEAMEAARKAAA